MRRAFRSLTVSVSVAALLISAQAGAHSIVVDGVAGDWSSRTPGGRDLGMVIRDSQQHGELVWSDAVGDARPGVSDPEQVADLASFRVTGDATNLYLLVTGPKINSNVPAQVQIAIDTDQAPGSGQSLFFGGAETQTSTNAEWEWLVQTRLRVTNADDPSVALWNGVTAKLADGDLTFGWTTDALEIQVPWSKLGLAGPPTTPLRLSVALFRDSQDADHTPYEIPGSDCLDALTDYGNPGYDASPGTAAEFPASDTVVDDFIDAWFDPQGEVYAPLIVNAVMPLSSVGGSGYWVQLKNQSPFTVNVAGLKLGNAIALDTATKGMFALPAKTVASGAIYTLAFDSAAFLAELGHNPDAEVQNGNGAIADATKFTAWATGSLSLTGSDNALLLDATNTMIDGAGWGSSTSSTSPALTSRFAPMPVLDDVLVRVSETDDASVDFKKHQACVNGGCGNVCLGCTNDACLPQVAGTLCADLNACDGLEKCDGAGSCAEGSPVQCTVPAPKCQGDSSVSYSGGACQPNGSCSFAATSTPCANGCIAGTGLCNDDPCAGVTCDKPPTQCHASTGTCSAGKCSYALVPTGTSCNDGDACTTADSCSAAGACAGAAKLCDAAPLPSCTDATTSLVYEASGVCMAGTCQYAAGKEICANGCEADTGLCAGDACVGVTCESAPSQCHYRSGSCDNGSCTYEPLPSLASCDDGDPCTEQDRCGEKGCAGTPLECNAPPPPVCIDGTTSRSFNASGACGKGGSCKYESGDTICVQGCDGATGLCVDDPCAGLACTAPPAGGCFLDNGSCERGGTCRYAPRAPGVPCNDGDPCTLDDACDGQGACISTSMPGCGEGGAGGAAPGDAGSGGEPAGGAATEPIDPSSGGVGVAGEASVTPSGGKGGTGGAGSTSTSGGDDASEDDVANAADDAGCSCRAVGTKTGDSAPVSALLLALIGVGLRWRRRSAA